MRSRTAGTASSLAVARSSSVCRVAASRVRGTPGRLIGGVAPGAPRVGCVEIVLVVLPVGRAVSVLTGPTGIVIRHVALRMYSIALTAPMTARCPTLAQITFRRRRAR